MSEIKTLADQLRSKIGGSENSGQIKKTKPAATKDISPKNNAPPEIPAILEAIRAYDNTDHKSMVHARFDERTAQTMNQLKMATGVDVTKLVAFAVRKLLNEHPELKIIIKQFFQSIE
jgi:hypothetical protein